MVQIQQISSETVIIGKQYPSIPPLQNLCIGHLSSPELIQNFRT